MRWRLRGPSRWAVPFRQLRQALSNFTGVPVRLAFEFTGHTPTIIDDTYNANPTRPSRHRRVGCEKPPRILVMATWANWGRTPRRCIAMSESMRAMRASTLYAVGKDSRGMAETFGANALHFSDHAALCSGAQGALEQGTRRCW